MKKLILPMLLLCSICVTASPSVFFDGTWEQAREKVKKENKYILLHCWTETSRDFMDTTVFDDPLVSGFLHQNFISVSRDAERSEEGVLLSMKYHISSFPSFYAFTPQGVLCDGVVYCYEAPQLIDSLCARMNPATQQLCTGFSNQLQSDYPSFYRQGFGAERYPADSAQVAQWLDKQTDPCSEVCWSVLWLEWIWLNEKHQQWVFDNREKLAALYGDEVWRTVGGLILLRIQLAEYLSDSVQFEACINMAVKYLPEPYRSTRIYTWRAQHAKRTNDWVTYAVVTDNYFRKKNYPDRRLTKYAWEVADHTSDTTALNIAIGWLEEDLKSDTCWHVYDAYAVLLNSLDRTTEAEVNARIAVEKANAEGEHASGSLMVLSAAAQRTKRK